MNTLKGRYKGRILMGDEYTMPWYVRRVPFWIPDMDIATNGGAPTGGITVLVGKPSVGKNALLNCMAAGQQRLYGESCAIAVLGTELSYDKTQARAQGVKIALSPAEIAQYEKLIGRPCSTEERTELQREVGTFIVVPPSTIEKTFDIAVDLVRSREFNVVGLDSFGTILSEAERDQSVGDAVRVAGPAGLNTQLMRKLCEAFAPDDNGRPNLTAFVGINQVRDKIGATKYEKQTQESGGWMFKHARFLTVELSQIGRVTVSDEDKTLIGKRIAWEITKQKAGGHEGHRGEYIYDFATCGIDMGELLLRLGQKYGLISRAGNTYFYCDGKIGVGAPDAARFIRNMGLDREITEEIMTIAGVKLVT